MAMRLSGLMSGMDTESVIEQLVAAKKTKVDNAKKAQTKLQWTQDAWKTLNSKILNLYNGILGNSMRFESSYMKKVTKVSNSSIVSVITSDSAMNSVQSLKVKEMAQSGYLTGKELGDGKQGYTTDTKLWQLGIDTSGGSIKVNVGGEEKEITVSSATTIGDLVQSFRDAGLNASFDTTNQRFYLASKNTGTDNDFSVRAGNDAGQDILNALGLSYVDEKVKSSYQKELDGLNEQKTQIDAQKATAAQDLQNLLTGKYSSEFAGLTTREDIQAKIAELVANDTSAAKDTYDDLEDAFNNWASLEDQSTALQTQIDDVTQRLADINSVPNLAIKNDATDAVIELNGVEYTSSRNTFEINGLTLTVNATTGENETVTLTTQDDTDGIYDMIKSFVKEYSELINEMDKLYNAESSKGYEPLTSEEKEAMSESEVEEWEKKIKDSLLRRDDTLGSVSTMLKQLMLSPVTVNGKKMYLSDFGIGTLSYFTAAENEKNALHIDGDPDDSNTANNEDKLRAMIATDPQTVIDFFVGLSREMYSKLTDSMAKTEYSSSYTIYEDVRMKDEYNNYTSKIKELEEKLSAYEDKWYQKFADMETALARLQSNASAVTALLGG